MGTTVTNSASGRRVGTGGSRMFAERPARFHGRKRRDPWAGDAGTAGIGWRAAPGRGPHPRARPGFGRCWEHICSPSSPNRSQRGPGPRPTAQPAGPQPQARHRLEPLEIHAQQPAAPGGVSARTTSSRSPGVQQGIFGGLPAAEGTQKPPEPSVRVARSPLGPSGSSQRPHPRIRKQQAQRAPSSRLIFELWGEQRPVLTYWEPPFETNSVTARKRSLS